MRTGRVASIANPSQGLKNISTTSSQKKSDLYWAHERGLHSEKYVEDYYRHRGYELLAQRLITPFAEIDLLFQAPEGHVLMVEVKTTNIADFQAHRISRRQKGRLLRALQFLAEKLECNVEVHWAFVTKQGEVTVIEDISG